MVTAAAVGAEEGAVVEALDDTDNAVNSIDIYLVVLLR